MRATGRTVRPLTILTAMLLSTALAGPAFAQIEEVVVTAQKRAEDVQTVPISITAYSAQDLAAHQIDQFKDLVFSTPNVSYTKGNFSGSDFQIRGIGITAVGYDAESGVAVHEDDVYLNAPPLAEASFYDLDRIEVLRGPQSTLYGRGATGGTVNIITAKPQLDAFSASGDASYGNYNAWELKGMVNIPIITDQLGLRLAGDWVKHDGYTDNIFNGDKIDDRDQYSLRGSVRWQPTDRTTVDFVGQYARESDNRMRSQKQLCASDPTGTLGCLPDALGFGAVNANANLSTIASSVQGLNSAFAGTPLAGLGAALGLFDLNTPPTLPGGIVNPTDLRKVSADFDPTYKADDTFFNLSVKQQLADWLDATLVLGYDKNNVVSQESYNNVAGDPLDQTRLAIAEGTLLGTLTAIGGPDYAANYAPYFSHPGQLPTSGVGGFGLISGNIANYSSNVTGFDQSNNSNKQYSAELRFNSKFSGPVNFLLAGYYLKTENEGDYYVNSSTLDYPSIVLGSILGAGVPFCGSGCILGPGYYHNDGDYNRLESKSIFGEVYWDAIPDTLKFTAGLRYTDDDKFQRGRISLFEGLVPIGTPDENSGTATYIVPGQHDYDCSNGSSGAGVGCGNVPPPGPNDLWQINSVQYRKWTGRLLGEWTPKVDFTDNTMFYASYSRGYKAGGFNPGIENTGGGGVSSSYGPEQIDAYEAGTKNLLAGGTLQANLDVWYYNYKGLQVSAIENNTSVNQNINAKLWGSEGEFLWAPSERWQFNFNVGYTHSEIGNSALIDDRNPTAGRSDVVLIKDATLASTVGQNCVLYLLPGQTVAPGDNAALTAYLGTLGATNPYFAPPGGSSSIASHGVAHTNYGTCLTEQNGGPPDALLNAFGYSRTDPTGKGNGSGAFVNLSGNKLQNTPDWTLSLGAQYTQPLDNDYNIVARVDYYWQDDMFGRIFNDAADHISSWDQWNAQLTLNAPDNRWYVQGFIKNIANKKNVTGMYLTSSTSGLYTNEFIGDPRTYGVQVGARF